MLAAPELDAVPQVGSHQREFPPLVKKKRIPSLSKEGGNPPLSILAMLLSVQARV